MGARRLSLRVLPRSFYNRDTELVARDLIGRVLECTRAEGLPSAVLIRAVRPVDGLAAMRRRRPHARSDAELANGPGKLCLAFGIDGPTHHGADLVRGAAPRILAGCPVGDAEVEITPRIGISRAVDWPLRWLLK